MLDQFVGEYRLHCNPDGLTVEAVDSANVQSIFTELQADAFDGYECDGIELGVVDQLGSVLRHARYGKSSDDPVTLSADGDAIKSTTNRQIGDADATLAERANLVEPAKIRSEPDLPELDYPLSVDLSPKTVIEAIRMLDCSSGNHVQLGTNHDEIVIAQQEDMRQRQFAIDADPSVVTEYTHFSADYIESIRKALQVGYVDEVTLRWDEDYPLMVDFEREGMYSGTIMTAPRITHD